MAVYTEVGDEELIAFVCEYDIGEVLSSKGIAEGIENSNFTLTTTSGTYI
ncbi:MAG: homoserine kinase, partial [Rhodospirillales bacterium]|nr:homoserine kinase [Rhodospirillales bacterium]